MLPEKHEMGLRSDMLQNRNCHIPLNHFVDNSKE